MDNKFKNSFIVVIVISLVVIIKIALKESIRENALNEIEKTYTPSNNSPSLNTLPVSDELPPSPSVSPAESIPAESTTANNTEIETEEITDGIKISRKETETWILSKLTSYTMESENIFNCSYSFQDGYLVYENDFQEKPSSSNHYMIKPVHRKVSIPINDFSRVEQEYGLIRISTNGKTIKHYLFENNKEIIDDSMVMLFNFDKEPNLIKRLQEAFVHLKTFYKKSNYKEAF